MCHREYHQCHVQHITQPHLSHRYTNWGDMETLDTMAPFPTVMPVGIYPYILSTPIIIHTRENTRYVLIDRKHTIQVTNRTSKWPTRTVNDQHSRTRSEWPTQALMSQLCITCVKTNSKPIASYAEIVKFLLTLLLPASARARKVEALICVTW